MIDVFQQNTLNPEESTTEIDGTFLFSQLLIDALLRMKPLPTDMNEFVTECAKEYAGRSESKDVQKFYNNYNPENPIVEYTKDSFLYKVINKALRVQNIDLIFLSRFLIRDIQQQLARNQCQSHVRVYRGQTMSTEEVNKLLSSVGQLISMNTMLSTSLERAIAEIYITGTVITGFERVLFVIDADPQVTNDVKPFANITQFSQFGDAEQEVLFMLGSVFRLTDLHQEDDQGWIASMTLCSDGDHELKKIFETLKDETQSGIVSDEANMLTFSTILGRMGRIDQADKFLQRALHEYRMASNEHQIDIANCYHKLGTGALLRHQYNHALEWFEKALNIYPKDDIRSATTYRCIGTIQYHQKNFKQARKSCNIALNMYRRKFGENNLHMARCYADLGRICRAKKQFRSALNYQLMVLAIRRQHLPSLHPDIALSHTDIAALHFDLKEYFLAIDHNQVALQIELKILPPDHLSLATSYDYLVAVYDRVGDTDKAKEYFLKAQAINEHNSLFAQQHPYRISHYQCPICRHHVWIYKIFWIVKGAPCFRCIRRIVTFGFWK